MFFVIIFDRTIGIIYWTWQLEAEVQRKTCWYCTEWLSFTQTVNHSFVLKTVPIRTHLFVARILCLLHFLFLSSLWGLWELFTSLSVWLLMVFSVYLDCNILLSSQSLQPLTTFTIAHCHSPTWLFESKLGNLVTW